MMGGMGFIGNIFEHDFNEKGDFNSMIVGLSVCFCL
jgi:hypothetical protein